jgi:mannose-6-phosphate isomerase-like protein (cupin superfamily)
MDELNRRDFAGLLAAALGAAAMAAKAEGQMAGPAVAGQVGGQGTAQAGAAPRQLPALASGIFKPQAGRGMQGGHESHQFLTGMLSGGTIRLEMHESVQQAGAPHEAVGTHKHSEIWLMQRGTATLYLNGTEHTMEAGDVGLCCAGDEHWIANKSDAEIAYFVVTVGPPE